MSITLTEDFFILESYQSLAFVCFGLWGWIIALNISHRQRIGVNALLHTTSNQRRPISIMATTLTLLLFCHIALLEHTIFKQHTNVFNHFGPVILSCAIAMSVILYFLDGQRFFNVCVD